MTTEYETTWQPQEGDAMSELWQILLAACAIYGVGAVIIYGCARKLTTWGKRSRKEALINAVLWWVAMVSCSTMAKVLF